MFSDCTADEKHFIVDCPLYENIRVKFVDEVIDLCPNFRYMDTPSKFVWLFTNEHEQVLISFCFHWFRIICFHFVDFVSFRFVFVDFVSFRFVFVDFVSFLFVSISFRTSYWTRILCIYPAGVCPFHLVTFFKFGNHKSNFKSVERRGIKITEVQ
jgi:hypothetical protein